MAHGKNRRMAYRPSLERLENRLQPGSLLGSDALAIDLIAKISTEVDERPTFRRPTSRTVADAETSSVIPPVAAHRVASAPVAATASTAPKLETYVSPAGTDEKFATTHAGPLPTAVANVSVSPAPFKP